MPEIETLYPIKKDNKKRNIIIISLVILLIVGIFVIFKNNKPSSNMNNGEQKDIGEPPENFSKENEEEIETNEIPPNYVNYICEKEGNYGALDSKISYKNKYRYEFFFDWDANTVTIGYYNVDFVFNSLTDYNNSSNLPIIFKNTFYEEKSNEENLTKTLMFYYKPDYGSETQNNLNSYLRALANDKFVCKLIEEESINID